MWIIFAVGAIVFTSVNLVCAFNNKKAKWFRFFGLALTALTLCCFYTDGAVKVTAKDWGGLMDIMPTMSNVLWICAIASIVLNSISLFKSKE